jgi:hypothetical protein
VEIPKTDAGNEVVLVNQFTIIMWPWVHTSIPQGGTIVW